MTGGFGEGGFGKGPFGGGLYAALVLDGPSPDVLAGAAGWVPTAASWLDGALLAGSIPITGGRLSAAVTSKVPETLNFTVPEYVDGVSWVPGDDPRHPLARFGQQIDLSIDVISSVTGEVAHWRLGRFQVHDWQHDDLARTVAVTALGVLARVQDARFMTPEVPRTGGTLGTEFRRLMIPGVSVMIDGGLDDRPCPQSFQWSQERLDALYDICDAWPARMRTDRWGTINVLAPLPAVPDPTVFLTDGEGGTLVSAPRTDTRDGLYNVVVGTSSATDTTAMTPIRAVAQITDGPFAVTDDGAGYGQVVKYWSSPLVTSQGQMQKSVDTMLIEASRPAVTVTVHCAPDPRISLDDAVSVTRAGAVYWGFVIAYDLPLTIDGGSMRIDIGLTS
jgi:hypothetical protein